VSGERALAALRRLPAEALLAFPSPVEEMGRLRAALGGGPRLLVKRDDAIPFGFGGNKVRKLALVATQARAEGAQTLVTTGGVQSNHCRATAAAAARLGFACHLVLNGEPPKHLTANVLLDELFGATLEFVKTRDERGPALERAVARLRAEGRRPFAIPLGASTPLGALAYARAVDELSSQGPLPSVIVHASSSGGTQAGILAGLTLLGSSTRVVGVSADERAEDLVRTVTPLAGQALAALGAEAPPLTGPVLVDDGFVGEGYGLATAASREAALLAARSEALLVDHTYTAKALAALLAGVRAQRFSSDETVLFWHTGGQVGLFA
jgi:1-aminocyclopropane-1-carboxylate deaminase/D-cysteine desulfhydrase-like pyridoxal-dependent ACC family enzyme